MDAKLDIFDNRRWHDGLLLSMQTISNVDRIDFILTVALYDDEACHRRKSIIIEFHNINHVTLNMKTEEILDNAGAGNIKELMYATHGAKSTFSLLLFGGCLKFSFDDFIIMTAI